MSSLADTRAVGSPAADAAGKLALAGFVLGVLALGWAAFALLRLLESWRVTPRAASHQIVVLGQKLSYPAANIGAVVVLVLAIAGLVVVAVAIVGAIEELRADRRFAKRMSTRPLKRLQGAFVFEDPRPRAFCTGLWRPRVYISTGAVSVLDDRARAAVLEHERHHAAQRDPLRLAAGRVLARALFLLPGYRALISRYGALAELSADESAIGARLGNRSALARAMLSFSDSAEAGELAGVDPVRVDHLLGSQPNWRFPVALFAVSASLLALVSAVAVLAGRTASGATTLSPPFLSHQPCVVVLALIPAALGLIARGVTRERARNACR